MQNSEWDVVVGLEVHVQINSQSKAFCSDNNQFGDKPNENISPITLAHPGTLPRANQYHIESAIKLGLAFNSGINEISFFDRKNYFYPDLPKGYQITQDNTPICVGGKVEYIMGEGSVRTLRIHHLHMEEDAGKSIHDIHPRNTVLDYNRAGVPLIEIVTEPDLTSSDEVYYFIQTLQLLVRSLGISDGNMEEGSFRCDCNVSVKKKGQKVLGNRCEIKNLNSKRFAKQAVEYEAARQIKILENGGNIKKTTMLYNNETNKTYPMRDKEEVNDYRYFNDPDLPPVILSPDLVNSLKAHQIQNPVETYKSLKSKFEISHEEALIITSNKHYTDLLLELFNAKSDPREATLLLINKVIPANNGNDPSTLTDPVFIERLKDFLKFLQSEKISKSAAYQHLYDQMWGDQISVKLEDIAKNLSILQVEDQSFLDAIINHVIEQNPDKVKAFKNGKKGLIGFFMGQVMKQSKGKANPQTLKQKLHEHLNR